MELIPLLRSHGYRYVLVDSEHVEPVTAMSWQELRYRPHIARYDDQEIVVVVRDRDLSNAQESGMELGWFLDEVAERTKWCSFPPLVTTCTDGENGGWFRNTTEGANFWSAFYLPLLERFRSGEGRVAPTFITDYLNVHGVHGEVKVRTGAWNTGWHHGRELTQWTGSDAQKQALQGVQAQSLALEKARAVARERGLEGDEALAHDLEEATWHPLRAETSCHFYWGEAWVHRADADLEASRQALARVRERIGEAGVEAAGAADGKPPEEAAADDVAAPPSPPPPSETG